MIGVKIQMLYLISGKYPLNAPALNGHRAAGFVTQSGRLRGFGKRLALLTVAKNAVPDGFGAAPGRQGVLLSCGPFAA